VRHFTSLGYACHGRNCARAEEGVLRKNLNFYSLLEVAMAGRLLKHQYWWMKGYWHFKERSEKTLGGARRRRTPSPLLHRPGFHLNGFNAPENVCKHRPAKPDPRSGLLLARSDFRLSARRGGVNAPGLLLRLPGACLPARSAPISHPGVSRENPGRSTTGTRCQSNLRRLQSCYRTATPLRGITPRDRSAQPGSEPESLP
jgi:hypothetical protein